MTQAANNTFTGWLIRRRLHGIDGKLAFAQQWCRNCDFPIIADRIRDARSEIVNQLRRMDT